MASCVEHNSGNTSGVLGQKENNALVGWLGEKGNAQGSENKGQQPKQDTGSKNGKVRGADVDGAAENYGQHNSGNAGGKKSNETKVVNRGKVARKRPPVPAKPNKIAYHLNANKIFRDGNDVHMKVARKIGVGPLASRDEIKRYSHKLVAIDAPNYEDAFVLDNLTHSTPHLVPQAAKLLQDIGYAFQDSLRNKHKSEYSVIVTSVLRTDADIKKLSKKNINSIPDSPHRHGTTIDISYARFSKRNEDDADVSEYDLKSVLTEGLNDFRNRGRCYVKYEVKQGCFHITAR